LLSHSLSFVETSSVHFSHGGSGCTSIRCFTSPDTSGSCGLGKTHLLATIANAHRAAERVCLFASAVRLFDAIQERLSQDRDYHDLLRRAIATPLLLLDDIDKLKASEFRQEVYYQIIDGRTLNGAFADANV
jgi:DNA replication protein DnaC